MNKSVPNLNNSNTSSTTYESSETAPEMRIFSKDGERLYLTKHERKAFLHAAQNEPPAMRMFCHVLHDTGCRPSEALELSAERILINEGVIVFRTLKKRTHDKSGRKKLAHYRAVPVSNRLLENLDLVFGIRQLQKNKTQQPTHLWEMSRMTHYRLIKRVMSRAKISGVRATGKGLRHGYGVAMITASNPVPIHLLAKAMGHSSTKTTEVYLQVQGAEEKALFLAAIDED